MITHNQAKRALEDFRKIVSSFEQRPVGLGVINTGDGWCVILSRRRKPDFAEELPEEIDGVPIIKDYGRPPVLGLFE